MRSLILTLSLAIYTAICFAQVTIGSNETPEHGFLLQLKDIPDVLDGSANATKGLGLPRVLLVDTNDLLPCAPNTSDNKEVHVGLTVYNLTTNSTLKEGIYTWDGMTWNPMVFKGMRDFGPWYQVATPNLPSTIGETDSYMGANIVVGGKDIIDNATLSIHDKVAVGTTESVGSFAYVDGNQGLGKTLMSDKNGNANWVMPNVQRETYYRRYFCNITSDLLLNQGVQTVIPGFDAYTVPKSGKYKMILHTFYTAKIEGSNSFYTHIYVDGVQQSMDETYEYCLPGSKLASHYTTIITVPTDNSIITVKILAQVNAPISLLAVDAAKNSIDILYLGK